MLTPLVQILLQLSVTLVELTMHALMMQLAVLHCQLAPCGSTLSQEQPRTLQLAKRSLSTLMSNTLWQILSLCSLCTGRSLPCSALLDMLIVLAVLHPVRLHCLNLGQVCSCDAASPAEWLNVPLSCVTSRLPF